MTELIGKQQPQHMPFIRMKPGRALVGMGVTNPEILIDVALSKDDTEYHVKLNKNVVIAFCKLECGTYKLFTSGGWNFYTKSLDFCVDKKEEETKDEENKALEVREFRA